MLWVKPRDLVRDQTSVVVVLSIRVGPIFTAYGSVVIRYQSSPAKSSDWGHHIFPLQISSCLNTHSLRVPAPAVYSLFTKSISWSCSSHLPHPYLTPSTSLARTALTYAGHRTNTEADLDRRGRSHAACGPGSSWLAQNGGRLMLLYTRQASCLSPDNLGVI